MNLKSQDGGDYNKSKFLRLLEKRVYIMQWLPFYTKLDTISDIIAGVTLGMTMMPQAMAYASLAGLPPHYGLYSSFMGSLIYVFFGTIKEVSIGPTSLMALLILPYSEKYNADYIVLLCFLCGWMELFMGVFKLGFMVDFISAPSISGFTSAMASIIILTQVRNVFGMKFSSHNTWDFVMQFGRHVSEIKMSDTILGVGSIIFLLLLRKLKDAKFGSRNMQKTFWLISISRNAIVVLLGCFAAYYYKTTTGKVPFTLSGPVIPGLPAFHLPNFSTKMGNETIPFYEMVYDLSVGIFVIPIVATLANVAIAKSFVTGKVVDATQEMISLGLCNIFGACVQSMPTCGAFTRSAVSNASGIKTPMAGIYSGTIIILALTFLTPYFSYVPKPSLAAVLITAVMFMIDVTILPQLWKINKFDFFICLGTFIVGFLYGMEIGLVTGVVLNLLPLLKLWTRPEISCEVCETQTGDKFVLIKPELGLFYTAMDYLTEEVVKISTRYQNKLPIVIDCSNFIQIDYTALQGISTIMKNHKHVVLLKANTQVYETLLNAKNINENDFCDHVDELNSKMFHVQDFKDVEKPLVLAGIYKPLTVQMLNERSSC